MPTGDKQEAPCPNCGYCKACGRGPTTITYPPYVPYWPYTTTITFDTNGTAFEAVSSTTRSN